mmetsp:Transcript_15811/g.32053  ORF Transcript_15811/g.32053 Transcript_15811/m.32053 type:complete len:206 (+) Transcript_15811:809-1426(+)
MDSPLPALARALRAKLVAKRETPRLSFSACFAFRAASAFHLANSSALLSSSRRGLSLLSLSLSLSSSTSRPRARIMRRSRSEYISSSLLSSERRDTVPPQSASLSLICVAVGARDLGDEGERLGPVDGCRDAPREEAWCLFSSSLPPSESEMTTTTSSSLSSNSRNAAARTLVGCWGDFFCFCVCGCRWSKDVGFLAGEGESDTT